MIESNEIIEIEDNGEVEFIRFKKLLEFPEINHAYILKSHNLSFKLGENQINMPIVKNNLKKVSNSLGFSYKRFLRPNYMHTNNVQIVVENPNDKVEDALQPDLTGNNYLNTDGLITSLENSPILSTNADCNLLLFYDPTKRIIANVHAGWRGTFGKIAKNTVEKMKNELNCNPKDILCFLCPSIRKCHFEVEKEVYDACVKTFEYTHRLSEIAQVGEIKEGKQKYFVDLVLINKILLEEEGVLPANIYDSGICSVCEASKVHSKRAEGINFGLGAAIIQKNR